MGCSVKPHYGLPMMSMPLVLGLQPEQVRGAAYLHADASKRNRVARAGQRS